MYDFYSWLEHLKIYKYCVCYKPTEQINFTMIDRGLWCELLENKESKEIIDRYLNK